MEESMHSPRVTGRDAQIGAACDGLEARIAMRGHFTKIGDGLKRGVRGAQLLQDVIFHAIRHDLGVGATTVEQGGGGFGHARELVPKSQV